MAKKDFKAALTTTTKDEKASAEKRFGTDLHTRFANANFAFGTTPVPAKPTTGERGIDNVATVAPVLAPPITKQNDATVDAADTSSQIKTVEQDTTVKQPIAEKRSERQRFLGAPGSFVESVSVGREDSDRIEDYRVRLARQRTFVAKAEIFRAGLLALNSLSDDEVLKLITEASRFRPTKKERKRAT